MDRRQFVLSSAGLSMLALALEGCGSGKGSSVIGGAFGLNGTTPSGGATGALQTTRGTVVLPAGFSLNLSELSVDNAQATRPLSATAGGAFDAQVQSASPSLVFLRHSSDRGVLFGFVDPASSSNVLDATAQATALLYMVVGGYTLPAERKRDVLTLIKNDPSVGPLATVIAARLVANPFALEDGDAQLGTALATAYHSLRGTVTRAATRAATAAPHALSARSGLSRVAPVPLQLLVQPGAGQQSGVEVLQDSNSVGITATNHYRRRCQVLIYETGTDDASGTHTDYPLVKPVGSPVPLGATTGLSTFSTLANLFSGQTAFVPVSTPVIPFTMASGATKTYFDVIVLGSANTQNAEPAFFSEAKYANELAGWRKTRSNLNLASLLADLALGVFLEVLGFASIVPDETAIQAAINGLYSIPDPRIATLLKNAGNGALLASFQDLVTYLGDSTSFGLAVRSQLATILNAAQQQAAVQVAQALPKKMAILIFKMINRAVGVAGLILGAGDIGAIIHDLSAASDADRWTATLFQPDVSLSPSSATISSGGSQVFTAKIPIGITGGSIVYAWSTTALIGNLSDGNGMTGRSFETSSASVTLQTTPSDPSPLTVSVTVYQVAPGGGRNKIGDATATVSLPGMGVEKPTYKVLAFGYTYPGSATVYYNVASFFLFNAVPVANQYYYHTTFNTYGVPNERSGTLLQADVLAGTTAILKEDLSPNSYFPDPNTAFGNVNNGFFNFGGGVIGLRVDIVYGQDASTLGDARALLLNNLNTIYGPNATITIT